MSSTDGMSRYWTMEKELPEEAPDIMQRSNKPSKDVRLVRLLLVILVIVSLLSISGLKTHYSAFGAAFPLSRLFGHRHSIPNNTTSPSANNEFRLVSVHRAGVGQNRNQVYQVLDIPNDSTFHALSPFEGGKYTISSMPRRTTHLANQSRQNIKDYITHSRLAKQAARDPFSTYRPQSSAAEWITRDIITPNITDKTSVTTLAKVASNAYIRIPDTEDWYDLGRKWNESNDFGWEENGLRGHVFANADNSTIVVAMKGTSPPFVGGSDTSSNDKINVTPMISRLIVG